MVGQGETSSLDRERLKNIDWVAQRRYGIKPVRGPDGKLIPDDFIDPDIGNVFSAFSNAVHTIGHAISSRNKAFRGNGRPLLPWNAGRQTFPRFKVPRPIVF